MSDTLYIKIDRSVLIKNRSVKLDDIAKMTSTNDSIVNKVKTLSVHHFQEPSQGNRKQKQYKVCSILKIIELIGKEYPNITVENVGETDFVMIYEPKEEIKWIIAVKTILSCVLIFFGGAFTIISFHNDAGTTETFSKLYQQIMGSPSNGFTALEISYSIGLGLGILVFFNHIGKKKVTPDPTPMQVQMRKYEEDVDTAFIDNSSRKGSSLDVE